MYKRFFVAPDQSFFLFGPRGTGKSTWLNEHYPDAIHIDLLNLETYLGFESNPERLVEIMEKRPEKKVVIIDEVQRVPEVLNAVHRMIEKKQGHLFVLTGSSARKLRRNGVNLLGGRALLMKMPPFYAAELGEDFNLESALNVGMLPLVIDSSSPERVIRSYVGMYLREEVQAEGIVRNLSGFSRFLEVMAYSHGSILNISNIAREAQVARKTVESYLGILNDLLLSFHLDVFHYKAKRTLIRHSKFYYFDAGVFSSLRLQNRFDVQSEKERVALEGLVAQHLKAWVDARFDDRLYFWRTSTQLEVDFIVSGPETFLAIEVKNSDTLHPKDFHGLKAFVEDYPEAIPIILYRGKESLMKQGVACLPVDEYLKRIHPAKLLPDGT